MSSFQVDDRVFIPSLQLSGTLRFLGKTQFKEGVWAGVELDVPQGKNNGVVNGIEYFNCKENQGLFIHPNRLEKISPVPVSTPAAGSSLPRSSSSSGLKLPSKLVNTSASRLPSSGPKIPIPSPSASTRRITPPSTLPTPRKPSLTLVAQSATKAKSSRPQSTNSFDSTPSLSKYLSNAAIINDSASISSTFRSVDTRLQITPVAPSPVDRYQAEIDVLKSQNNLLSIELNQGKIQLDTAQTQSKMLHAQLLDCQSEKEDVQQNYEWIKKEMDTLITQMQKLKSEQEAMKSFEADIEMIQKNLDKLMSEKKLLEADNDHLRKQLSVMPDAFTLVSIQREDKDAQTLGDSLEDEEERKMWAEKIMQICHDSELEMKGLKDKLDLCAQSMSQQSLLISDQQSEIEEWQRRYGEVSERMKKEIETLEKRYQEEIHKTQIEGDSEHEEKKIEVMVNARVQSELLSKTEELQVNIEKREKVLRGQVVALESKLKEKDAMFQNQKIEYDAKLDSIQNVHSKAMEVLKSEMETLLEEQMLKNRDIGMNLKLKHENEIQNTKLELDRKYQEEIKSLKDYCDKLSAQNQELTSKIAKHTEQTLTPLKEKDEEISVLKRQIKEMLEERAMVSTGISEEELFSRIKESVTHERREHEKEIESLRETFTQEMMLVSTEYKGKIETEVKRVKDDLLQQVNSKQQEIFDLRQVISGLETKQSTSIAELEKMISSLKRAHEEDAVLISQLKSENERLENELETAFVERDAARDVFEKVEHEKVKCFICDKEGDHSTENCPVKWCENCENNTHRTEECTFADETF